jgi:SAM-dependent methyltransferase
MGLKTSRQKPRNLLLSVIYRLQKLLPLGRAARFKLFLNLEWIFDRLAHEASFDLYTPEKHPLRQFSMRFILDQIDENSSVLDLGCNQGDMSCLIAKKAKEVVGIDLNREDIEIAKKRNKKNNLSFHHTELHAFLENNKTQFDCLILSHIQEHLNDPHELLINFKGYFKFIYIEVPDFDRNYLNHYRKDLKLDLIYSDNDHIWEFDRDELSKLLRECGIQIIKSEYRYGVQKLCCERENTNLDEGQNNS